MTISIAFTYIQAHKQVAVRTIALDRSIAFSRYSDSRVLIHTWWNTNLHCFSFAYATHTIASEASCTWRDGWSSTTACWASCLHVESTHTDSLDTWTAAGSTSLLLLALLHTGTFAGTTFCDSVNQHSLGCAFDSFHEANSQWSLLRFRGTLAHVLLMLCLTFNLITCMSSPATLRNASPPIPAPAPPNPPPKNWLKISFGSNPPGNPLPWKPPGPAPPAPAAPAPVRINMPLSNWAFCVNWVEFTFKTEAELIILLSLLFIGQNLVCFLDLYKLFSGILLLVGIWVILFGQLETIILWVNFIRGGAAWINKWTMAYRVVGFLDLALRSVLFHTEHFVRVAFGCTARH